MATTTNNKTNVNVSEKEVPSDGKKNLVVDIGVNLTNKAFRNHWKDDVKRAIDAGVDVMILTGTSVESSRKSLELANLWFEETGQRNLFATVGVHPHDAKTFNQNTKSELQKLLEDPFAVAVGECGLDYNRNFSCKSDQVNAFKEQIKLSCELQKPMFVHEREASDDLKLILDETRVELGVDTLPPIVVHCFTGTEEEALEYIERGYYIGFTGTICKKERGAPLRDILPKLPLEKLMVETDAPFMGFKRGRRCSYPEDVVDVARKIGETRGDESFEEICQRTTSTALQFFRIEE